MPIYKKLVRDNIPEILKSTGKEFSMRILSEEEYQVEVNKKLNEELEEYYSESHKEAALEELADILELIQVAAEIHGASFEQLQKICKSKADKNGAFKKRVFLIEVKD